MNWSNEGVGLALQVLDRKVAAIFNQEPRKPLVLFVPVIKRILELNETGEVVITKETRGDCAASLNRIRLVMKDGWQKTAIHELIHLYNPTRSEHWVKQETEEVIRFLKHPFTQGKLAGAPTSTGQSAQRWTGLSSPRNERLRVTWS